MEQTVQIFGKPVNLQQEWQKVAGQLGSLCEGNRYIEYDKEIARLRAKLLHLQEEADRFRTHNKDLSSMNDDLMAKVKDLISMQDDQLEHYSTALVLLTEERKELWQSLGTAQKRIQQLKKQMASCKCQNVSGRDICADVDNVGSTHDVGTNTEEVICRLQNNMMDSAGDNREFAEPLPLQKTRSVDNVERHIESLESSFESQQHPDPVKSTPKAKGTFVNSMIQKLEKSDKITKKYKLKSFEEPKHKRLEEMVVSRKISVDSGSEKSDDVESIPDSVPDSLSESSESVVQVDAMKFRVAELEQEVIELRNTCQSLTTMLERTYDEMQSSTLERDDAKDQLIACLRARLLEAICDLMKVEKRDVKSVACGSSLPRVHKLPEPSAPPLEVFSSHSDPNLSPTKSKFHMLQSPKFKALRDDNFNKLRKLSCWKIQNPDESA